MQSGYPWYQSKEVPEDVILAAYNLWLCGSWVLAVALNTRTNKGIFERLAWLITRSRYLLKSIPQELRIPAPYYQITPTYSKNYIWIFTKSCGGIGHGLNRRFWLRSGFFCGFWIGRYGVNWHFAENKLPTDFDKFCDELSPLHSPGGSVILGGGLRSLIASSFI